MRAEVELIEALLLFDLRWSWLLIELEAFVGLRFRRWRLLIKSKVETLILGSRLRRTLRGTTTKIEVELVICRLLKGILL